MYSYPWKEVHQSCFKHLISKMTFPNFPLPIRLELRSEILHIKIFSTDRDEKDKIVFLHTQIEVPPLEFPRDNEYAFRWVMRQVESGLLHELREHVLLDGHRILDPHKPVHESMMNPGIYEDLLKGMDKVRKRT